ncbi:murein hydrolase activator EnvC family protein [Allochromatium palmeri]|uniref:Peptidoglycan DD-metalloendopeptidase family protein n=1 Tax=Allochromatium palmeri TaxID=231048 RepID=A0A6N8EA88_9GAMM|nr:peptidoglycan DD-metalloendopeptidase family protein [Allochromatium palmeri]MTW19477.1 peptidoglycan DD-metalloendopeptidase family protein [Allochromatium palmeri]
MSSRTLGSNPTLRRGTQARARGRFSSWLLAGLLSSSSLLLAQSDSYPALDARQQDLSETQRQVQEIGRELTVRSEDRRALIAELEARERNVAELSLANRELERLVAEHNRVASELRARQVEERAALGVELDLLSDLLRTAYVMGRADRLRLLLNQEDLTRASRVMSYFAYFNRERMKRIQAVQQRAERLDRLARSAEEEAHRLAELARSQEATRRRLEQAKQRRAQVLRDLESAISSRAETLEGLKRDAESLKMLVEHLRQHAQIRAELDIQHDPFATLKGQLAWPLLENHILAAFGTRKEASEIDWDGVLLAAHEGEEVRAVKEGRVVHADWLRGFGLLIVIDHGDGYMTFYGHNEALLREVGEWVATGDPIALSGKSGGRREPVLYFAIRHNGRPQDPAAWCASHGRYDQRSSRVWPVRSEAAESVEST